MNRNAKRKARHECARRSRYSGPSKQSGSSVLHEHR
jgi:hypothetical protein